MSWWDLVRALEQIGLAALGLFSLHRLWLLFLALHHRHHPPRPPRRFELLPLVTVQLPVYNERYVIERLLTAVARLDYPKDRLEIQVVDDSTDETPQLVAQRVVALQAQGFHVVHLRRTHRAGFKAGALAEALTVARGEFTALFDADFVPPPDFLQRTIHYFTDPRVGMVQARWGYLNREESFLTRAQALMMDGHFLIEQVARSRSGCLFNFNGSSGIWRRQTILDGGGWQADTLAEDLDLSYRAQLAGWRFLYLSDVMVPGELPADIGSLKIQQHRWTKGSIQAALKLLPLVWRSRLPLRVKLEAGMHLGSWFHYPLGLLVCLLMLPVLILSGTSLAGGATAAWEGLVGLLLVGTTALCCAVAHRHDRRDWGSFLHDLPAFMAVSTSLALNNTRAALEAFRRTPSPFHRTPKYNGNRLLARRDDAPRPWQEAIWGWSELALGLQMCAAFAYAVFHQLYAVLPFLAVVTWGFLYAALASLAPWPRLRLSSPNTS